MERLTYIKCPHRWSNGRNPTPYSAKETLQVVCNKLGKIEDILGDDYDLDRLRELVEADQDGRCVPVVRCRECKHYTDWGACGNTDNGWDAPQMGPDDFCSLGEKAN